MSIKMEIEDEKVEIQTEDEFLNTETFFKAFIQEHKKQLLRLGLQDWKTYYRNIELNENFAITQYDCHSRGAAIDLALKWTKYRPPTLESIIECAKHEAIHLLLADLLSKAKSRFATLEEIDRLEEGIVRVLEKYL